MNGRTKVSDSTAEQQPAKGQRKDMRRKNKKIDMLNGSIWDKMIVFALPLAFTGMLQQLFNAADVAVLGRFVSNESMAGVGNNVPSSASSLRSAWVLRSAPTSWWRGCSA